jgi:phosphoribosylamine--glycine ligase
MNILVVGSGGREHAICSTFAKSPRVDRILCANGNAGISSIAECFDVSPTDVPSLAELASEQDVNLTFVGGEASLALGIVDEFEKRGFRIIGPKREAARLESSKAFAKDFMARYGVPTARHVTSSSPSDAIEVLRSGSFGEANMPVVVKADGLAAGKGVVVARDRAEAVDAIEGMASLVGADATEKIILEECLTGREVSLLMFADGEDFALMPATRDHKRVGEGDTGPNTGGMGAITDDSLLSAVEIDEIEDTMIRPTLRGCMNEGMPFRGVLFLGLMMTPSGPRLLEYNVRFGDPETQAILVRLETDLVGICEAMLTGNLADRDIKWKEGSSACVVLASEGYPSKPRTGDVIEGLEQANEVTGVEVFHAGTSFSSTGQITTAGGRVLGVTAVAADLCSALSRAYEGVSKITWPGMHFRRDIGSTATSQSAGQTDR